MFSKFQLYSSDQMSQTHHKIKVFQSLHFYPLLRQAEIFFQTVAQISFQLSILDFALPREYADRGENPFLEDID